MSSKKYFNRNSECAPHYHLAMKNFQENIQTGFVVAGGGFLSFWNHQLIMFEEKIFGIVIMKNER